MKPLSRQDFVTKYLPYVNQLVKGTGILPGTMLSQAIAESSANVNGQYLVGANTLAQKANNLFSIQADKDWRGNIYYSTDHHADGTKYKVGFRSYNSVEDGMKDYVNFLLSNSRYKSNGVFDAKTVKDQAAALQNAGYAESAGYSDLIDSVYNSISKFITTNKKTIGFGSIALALAAAGFLYYNHK